MAKRDKHYTLKIYDTPLVDFYASNDDYGRLDVKIATINESARPLFPLQLLLETNSESIIAWLKGRTVPKNRRFVDKILETAGLNINDTLGILDVCKGLSVNDSYWLDDGSAELLFSNINLFENELDETLALVAYTGYSTSQKHKLGLSTEWTTDGQFPKAWRRIDESLYLFKAGTEGYANAGMEPYSEYLAAQVAERMGIPHVPYDLQKWKGKLASVCPLLNSKDISFVPYWVASNQSRFPSPLAAAFAFSDETFEQLRSMTIFDALICNTDRHAANYGMLRDNHTGEVLGPAPLFDHNFSLFPGEMSTDFPFLHEKANSVFAPAASQISFKDQASIVMGDKQHEQLQKMIGFQFKNHPDYPLPEDRLSALNTYIEKRTQELIKIPAADEATLRRKMSQELTRLKEPIPMLKAADEKP